MAEDEAFSHEQAGRPLEAIAAYERSLQEYPEDCTTLVNFALLLKYRGDLQRSEQLLRRALDIQPSKCRTDAIRLLDGGKLFGDTECPTDVLARSANVLRRTLQANGYTMTAVRARLLSHGAQGGPPTGTELMMLRYDNELMDCLQCADSQGMLLLLFAVGAAIPSEEVTRSLGESNTSELVECGLLLRLQPWNVLAAPMQVYPLQWREFQDVHSESDGSRESDDLLVATDFDAESLLPTKFAVMAVGVDSLNLAYAQRDMPCGPAGSSCRRILDVCCGSGVQALVAAKLSRSASVVALDVNPRAIRFCKFNALVNNVAGRLSSRISDVYAALDGEEPFDTVLANPPFVAVPPLPTESDTNAEWALYADGGPDGVEVLNRIIRGAADPQLLRPGGLLAIVSEFPNLRSAHEWIPAAVAAANKKHQLEITVVFNPRHIQDAKEYADERAAERGWPWASLERWETSLCDCGVDHVGPGLLFAINREAPVESGRLHAGVSCPLELGVESENQVMLLMARKEVSAVMGNVITGALR
mmetsp:Transcript_43215/g.113508  ORF Transcript_43215/g.113508 Transcript_43215/m.113508 type:complete len:532 (+) Transcript_43215:122-1717(+)